MSGGSFDYQCYQIEIFAENLQERIENNGLLDENGWGENMSPATLSLLSTSQHFIHTAALLAKEIEWLYSDDIGEEDFSEAFEKIMVKFTGGNYERENIKYIRSSSKKRNQY